MFLWVLSRRFASLCVFIGPYVFLLVLRTLLVLTRSFESLLVFMRLFASLWVLMGPYKFLCVLKGPIRSLWVLMRLCGF